MPVPWKDAGCRPLWRSVAVAEEQPIPRSQPRPPRRAGSWSGGCSSPAPDVIDQVRDEQAATQSQQEVDGAPHVARRLPTMAVGLIGKAGRSTVSREDAGQP